MKATLVCSRLDRLLVSVDWEDHFPQVQSSCLAISISDHKPILLKTSLARFQERRHGFRFEKFWLREDKLYGDNQKGSGCMEACLIFHGYLGW